MAHSGDHTVGREKALHWMTHWDHLLVLLWLGPLGSFQEMGGLGSLRRSLSLNVLGRFMDTRQSKLRHVSRGSVCFAGSSTVGVFLWQRFVWNPHSHHLAYLKRCGLGIVLLALSMHLA